MLPPVVAQLARLNIPNLNPPPGDYNRPLGVSLSGDVGASLHFRMEGQSADCGSANYVSPLTINRSSCINAVACRDCIEPSLQAIGCYRLFPKSPQITPAGGVFVEETLNVAFAYPDTDIPGVVVRYETGWPSAPDPGTNSPTAPSITLNRSTVVKARAFIDGWELGVVAVKSYEFKVQNPTTSPPFDHSEASSYGVTVLSPTEGDTQIYYTIDGSEPFCSGTLSITNGGRITINSSVVLKVKACREGWTSSDALSGNYFVGAGTVRFTPASPFSSNAPFHVTINTPNPDARICYTTDGSAPEANSSGQIIHGDDLANGGSVLIYNSPTSLRAIAYGNGFVPSPENSGLYRNVGNNARLGEEVVPPAGVGFANPPIYSSYTVTNVSTTNRFSRFAFVSDASKVFGVAKGADTIHWWFPALGSYVEFEHTVTPHDDTKAVTAYQTELGSLIHPVELGSVPFVRVHYNEIVTGTNGGNASADSPFVWLDASRNLHVSSLSGLVVLELKEGPESGFIGMQVVRLKPYLGEDPQLNRTAADIGAELTPFNLRSDVTTPYVTRGGTGAGASDFIYQHSSAGPMLGKVFAIRRTDPGNTSQMEVVWTQRDRFNRVIWPFEIRRYTANWPANPQKYVIARPGELSGPTVSIPPSVQPILMRFQEPAGHALLLGGQIFTAVTPGLSLLRYEMARDRNQNPWVGFQVVQSVFHDDPAQFNLNLVDWPIGSEITNSYHQPVSRGFIHLPFGDRFAENIYTNGSEQIFAVNLGRLEVWWSNLRRDNLWPNNLTVQWPSLVVRYNDVWPTNATPLVIASQRGGGPLDPNLRYNRSLYVQNDPTAHGFNPNDEHAIVDVGDVSETVFAFRDDLGRTDTSEPYVLLQYQVGAALTNKFRFNVYRVVAEGRSWDNINYSFTLSGVAGTHIQPPLPLSGSYQPFGYGVSGPFWRNRKQEFMAKSAGDDGGNATVVMRYYYDVRNGFYFPADYQAQVPGLDLSEGKPVPWLDLRAGTPGQPIDINYIISWPTNAPVLRFGETLTVAKFGLPDIRGQSSVDIIYQQSQANGVPEGSVKLIDPTTQYQVSFANLPSDIKVAREGNKTFFTDLPPHLQRRFWHEGQQNLLRFEGQLVDEDSGEDYLLLNVITERDRAALKGITRSGPNSAAFQAKVDELFNKARRIREVNWSVVSPIISANGTNATYSIANPGSNGVFRVRRLPSPAVAELYLYPQPAETPNGIVLVWDSQPGERFRVEGEVKFDSLALTAGDAKGAGYVTLAFADNGILADPAASVSLEVINVQPPLYRGELAIIKPPGPFDEKLTLRHKGDFAGRTEDYQFEWMSRLPDGTVALPPTNAALAQLWSPFRPDPQDGQGAVDVTIQGASLYTLSDHWFVCRYRPTNPAHPLYNQWSQWTEPQIAEGWIKRVLDGINPYEQCLAALRIDTNLVNVTASMISRAGPRWEGAIPLNTGSCNDNNLIAVYETVFKRGKSLSIDGTPSIPSAAANDALLLVAGRLADLYMLLGNEAYADAADPTISFGADGQDFGAQAPSIHCFQNQTATLLEEELKLLRGRSEEDGSIHSVPAYNRLFWNFTRDIVGGEVAYALNYSITDLNHDGVIDEADGRIAYPQGHGDAWGHYLTAINFYYSLLRNTNFAWVSRSETINLGGVPIQVDYLDERKFATAAAAKAKTGAEIVSLTYRDRYTEDPDGQWRGYRDTSNADRAWGVTEWAERAGQGAYLDWVVGNALLIESDPNPAHTGIQKIDRTTVKELTEIIGAFGDIQQQMDLADRGVNPLGVAKDALPFDISPALIDQGKTHFEQIYDRAVQAMNNAISVFNYAHNSAQALRRQADTVAEFQRNAGEREVDFKNRLIEIYGYPYTDDIGTGKTYPQGYDGPDVYHYFYFDPTELVGLPNYNAREFTVSALKHDLVDDVGSGPPWRDIKLNLSSEGFGFVKPKAWKGKRRAPGEIQMSHSDLIQSLGRFKKALQEYANLVGQIGDQGSAMSALVRAKDARLTANDLQILIYDQALQQQTDLNAEIAKAREKQNQFQNKAAYTKIIADVVADSLAYNAGLSFDPSGALRGVIRTAGSVISQGFSERAQDQSLVELGHQQAKELVQAEANIQVTISQRGTIIADSDSSITAARAQLQQLIRSKATQELEIYTLQEAMDQASARYVSILAKAQRIEEERGRFRNQTSAQVQGYRYRDMAFRIFRNDAVQKYRAQFDLAARYVYLAAKAYDFETGLLNSDVRGPGQQFLTDIVKSRSLGLIVNGSPQTGGRGDAGLADPMARMIANFTGGGPNPTGGLKAQLGFNNSQNLKLEFSLRKELMRLSPGESGDALWRERLQRYIVANLRDLPECNRYCELSTFGPIEPAIVIPFQTHIGLDVNFFGWSGAAGDSVYSPTYSTIKIRNVGIGFQNYSTSDGGLLNTPYVFLIPVGDDTFRSPTGRPKQIRKWKVFDQSLPIPFPLFQNPGVIASDYIPLFDTLDPTRGAFSEIRQFREILAYQDDRPIDALSSRNSGLIGRSVWNSRWLLIIPGRRLLQADPIEGLQRFINGKLLNSSERDGNGVSDIKLNFETYSYSGN